MDLLFNLKLRLASVVIFFISEEDGSTFGIVNFNFPFIKPGQNSIKIALEFWELFVRMFVAVSLANIAKSTSGSFGMSLT